ncbi:MAG: YfaZ family outer membrane protein [Desulfosarcinaceae bacterium]|nr:YfaZ family outer membrane protein [Desulfosarcinaceae bacterium]
MKRTLIILGTTLLVLSLAVMAGAESYRVELHAGGSSIHAGMDAKYYVNRGYMKIGGDLVYSDDDDEKYTIGDVRFLVGSETLYPGLEVELGFKGLVGKAEDEGDDAEVAGLGFMGAVAYKLPEYIAPIPIEVWLNMTGAPEPLSFADLESYFDFKTGVSFYIVESAAAVVSYRYHSFEVEENGDDYDIRDDTFTVGLQINF